MLFQRTDVRYSACQHVQGRHRCKYCTEYWFETQKATRWDHQPFWPPLETDGCQGKVFPLLLDHDGQDIGGDGSAKTDLALSIMPDAMADRLIQEQLDELDELEGDDEDEDGFEADFDVMAKYQDKCKAWLATELDDARLAVWRSPRRNHRSPRLDERGKAVRERKGGAPDDGADVAAPNTPLPVLLQEKGTRNPADAARPHQTPRRHREATAHRRGPELGVHRDAARRMSCGAGWCGRVGHDGLRRRRLLHSVAG